MTSVAGNVPTRSPWVAQMEPDGPPRPLAADIEADVVVVGAGIAGVSTAFFTLRNTDHDVVLIERSRVARGATGHNAGQLTTYFERPLGSLVDEFGFEMAIDAQRGIERGLDLLELMATETGADGKVERFEGRMGMYTLNHLQVHLAHSELRRRGGLPLPRCVVSEDAEFLADIPDRFDGLYSVVPQAEIGQLLGTTHGSYRAVLCEQKGCGNSAVLVQQVLDWLLRTHGHRFRYFDTTLVEHVALHDGSAVVTANGHTIGCRSVVLCTNGFTEHVVENLAGDPIDTDAHHINGTVGYMSGFFEDRPRPPAAISYILNQEIGGDIPYVYVTRRTYDERTLTCMGGPEIEEQPNYDADAPFPGEAIDEFRATVLPFAQPERDPQRPFDFHWHGLMGYTEGRVRMVGFEPYNPVLLYNLGCNGIGFLPSIFGGERISRLLAGEELPPSIFDPR